MAILLGRYHDLFDILPHDAMLVRYMPPSCVCLSVTDISKRLNVGSHNHSTPSRSFTKREISSGQRQTQRWQRGDFMRRQHLVNQTINQLVTYMGWQWSHFLGPYTTPAVSVPWCETSSTTILVIVISYLYKLLIKRIFSETNWFSLSTGLYILFFVISF